MSSEDELDHDEYDDDEEEEEEDVEEDVPVAKKRRNKQGGKEKKKKDPNKPKRNMSAYFLYSNASRERVKKENPSASFGDLVSFSFEGREINFCNSAVPIVLIYFAHSLLSSLPCSSFCLLRVLF